MYFSDHKDRHEFCDECGLCLECGDCNKLGCGSPKTSEEKQ